MSLRLKFQFSFITEKKIPKIYLIFYYFPFPLFCEPASRAGITGYQMESCVDIHLMVELVWISYFFFFFLLFGPHPWHMEVPSPQQRGQIRVTYTTAHSNTGSPTHWVTSGIKPTSSWILAGFVTTEPQRELPGLDFLLRHVKPGWECSNTWPTLDCPALVSLAAPLQEASMGYLKAE